MNDPSRNYRKQVAAAFSRQSPHYDAGEGDNPILHIMRRQVRADVEAWTDPGMHILELNAGTGMDATYFAGKGMEVTATDIAPGMVEEMRKKTAQPGISGKIRVVRAGFHELSERLNGPFGFVFSNMGGLNCEKDLTAVFEQLSILLKPGAHAILVIMPPVCPWEIATAIQGRWQHAFRRLGKKGTAANVEGLSFTTYYHSRKDIRKMLPGNWELLSTSGLGALLPQPHSTAFVNRHPTLFKWLVRADEKVRHHFPFNRWADHLVVRLRYKG